nr:MAG TPA: hypothetical protein [Caudoviricetes sp.]
MIFAIEISANDCLHFNEPRRIRRDCVKLFFHLEQDVFLTFIYKNRIGKLIQACGLEKVKCNIHIIPPMRRVLKNPHRDFQNIGVRIVQINDFSFEKGFKAIRNDFTAQSENFTIKETIVCAGFMVYNLDKGIFFQSAGRVGHPFQQFVQSNHCINLLFIYSRLLLITPLV